MKNVKTGRRLIRRLVAVLVVAIVLALPTVAFAKEYEPKEGWLWSEAPAKISVDAEPMEYATWWDGDGKMTVPVGTTMIVEYLMASDPYLYYLSLQEFTYNNGEWNMGGKTDVQRYESTKGGWITGSEKASVVLSRPVLYYIEYSYAEEAPRNSTVGIGAAYIEAINVAPQQPSVPSDIKVTLNGTAIQFDQPPVIESGRTLVPLRAIFEALGAKVDWNQATQTVTATKDSVTVSLQIGSNILIKNGENITLDVPAKIVGGRTLVPARAIAESFGATVNWDSNTQTVIITNP